jgi:predicted lipoprotein
LKDADLAALEPGVFRGWSLALKGVTALERLLYPLEEHGAEEFRASGGGNFRCAWIAAIGDNLAAIADSIVDEGAEGEAPYRGIVYSPGPENPEFQPHRLVGSLLQPGLIVGLEVITRFKLGRTMAGSAEKAGPKRAEAWRSGRSLALIPDNLSGLRQLYTAGGG